MDFSYPWQFESRRATTMASNGMVATSHPIAAQTGVRILEEGGTAADAAVATAAVLNVVEPHMTGIGGDVFALINHDGEIVGLNGSGRSPHRASVDAYRTRIDGETDQEPLSIPATGGLPVTVPGALDAWAKLVSRFGDRTLEELLQPAIDYASDGVPVTEYIARQWRQSRERLRSFAETADTFLVNGKPPGPGTRFRNPDLANTFEQIAREGIDVFYDGPIGSRVVDRVQEHGGMLRMRDLRNHECAWTEPLTTTYRDIEVVEHPPNGQGIIAMLALNIVAEFDLSPDPADPERLHRLIEATKLAFADGYAHITDPERHEIPIETMLSQDYANDRAGDITEEARIHESAAGDWSERHQGQGPNGHGDETVYLTVVDGEGMAVSLINSVYMNFGSGLTVGGFAIQNRGHSFSLKPTHPNRIESNKRPFHTIIPAMLREDGEFRASWGVMGGSMQPQGHLQVVTNLVDSSLNPQVALDVPRFRWLTENRVAVETDRLPEETMDELRSRKHDIVTEQQFFERGGHWGGGQIIVKQNGILLGGSDPRRDGQAQGF